VDGHPLRLLTIFSRKPERLSQVFPDSQPLSEKSQSSLPGGHLQGLRSGEMVVKQAAMIPDASSEARTGAILHRQRFTRRVAYC
jgi:hypothetical protein